MKINELIVKLETTKESNSTVDSIIEIAKELFDVASRETSHLGMMVSNYYHAFYYAHFKRNFKRALQYVNAAIEEEKEVGHNLYQMKSYDLRGVILIELDSPYDACMDFLTALKIASLISNKEMISLINNHIGDVFLYLGDIKQAYDYYIKSKDMINSIDVNSKMIYQKCMYNYIYTNIYLGKYDNLVQSFNKVNLMLEDDFKEIFRPLKMMVDIYNKTTYSESNIIDDVYRLMLKIDAISDNYIKVGQLVLMSKLIEYTNDINLYQEYLDLLEYYKEELNSNNINMMIYKVRETLIGKDSEDNYIESLEIKNTKLLFNLSEALKKILDLNQVVIERDSEIKKNKELMELSNTDFLTKLYNRRYTEAEISNLLNDKTKTSYAFIIIDVDKFKEINDDYGHKAGDDALVFLASALKKVFNNDSIVSRLGGDEFVCMLYNLPTEFEIRKSVVTFKVDELESYLKENNLEFLDGGHLSVSVGITLEGSDFSGMYSNADVALYNSKFNGRGSYTVYPDKNI